MQKRCRRAPRLTRPSIRRPLPGPRRANLSDKLVLRGGRPLGVRRGGLVRKDERSQAPPARYWGAAVLRAVVALEVDLRRPRLRVTLVVEVLAEVAAHLAHEAVAHRVAVRVELLGAEGVVLVVEVTRAAVELHEELDLRKGARWGGG